MTDEQLLTVREVARRCNRSEETVRRWIWSGKLPARKIGNQLFVELGALEAMQAPRVAEPKAVYRVTRRGQGGGKQPVGYTPVAYDPEEELRKLERIRNFGDLLFKQYGYYDVSEALRRVREDYD
jgi:excisionase family DNA binding protein